MELNSVGDLVNSWYRWILEPWASFSDAEQLKAAAVGELLEAGIDEP